MSKVEVDKKDFFNMGGSQYNKSRTRVIFRQYSMLQMKEYRYIKQNCWREKNKKRSISALL